MVAPKPSWMPRTALNTASSPRPGVTAPMTAGVFRPGREMVFEALRQAGRPCSFLASKGGDANPDLGDSGPSPRRLATVASAAASPAPDPAGGPRSVADATRYSRLMYHVTTTRNPALSLPNLDLTAHRPASTRKVVDTGIRPVVTTGSPTRRQASGRSAPASCGCRWPVTPRRCALARRCPSDYRQPLAANPARITRQTPSADSPSNERGTDATPISS